MKFAFRFVAGAAVLVCAFAAHAQKGETVKIAWIDPQTGLMGPVGNNQLKSWQFFAEKFSQNNPAGVKFEVVGFDNKLSPAAMETLAIIAYKQPVIRVDIEAIRGVAVGEVIRSLMYKGLVKIVGRAEILGRPMLYGTTRKFLEVFGLNSLKDLPKAEELKKPD